MADTESGKAWAHIKHDDGFIRVERSEYKDGAYLCIRGKAPLDAQMAAETFAHLPAFDTSLLALALVEMLSADERKNFRHALFMRFGND